MDCVEAENYLSDQLLFALYTAMVYVTSVPEFPLSRDSSLRITVLGTCTVLQTRSETFPRDKATKMGEKRC